MALSNDLDLFVEVVAKSTGTKQVVPAAWLDDEVLSQNFKVPPSSKKRVSDASSEAGSNDTPA